MNSLSWFLVIGDITSNFKSLFVMLGILLGIVAIIYVIATATNNGDYRKGHYAATEKWNYKNPTKILIVSFIFVFLASLIPSKETFYLVAASEVSEKVMQNEKVNGVLDSSLSLVKKKIDEELSKKE